MSWLGGFFSGTNQRNDVSVRDNYGNIALISSVGGAAVPVQLSIAWHPVADIADPTPSQLLTWRGRLTPLIGRAPELAALLAWVDLSSKVSVWPLAGEGGVGKTRLAAEFADELAQKHGWSAGFVDLGAFSDAAELNVHQNTLLLVDYPEERPAQLARLVDLVNRYTGAHKLRVLLLTRDTQGVRKCLSDRSAAHLEHSKSWQFAPASLSPYELFKAAFLARSVSGEKPPSLPNESEFNAWLSKSPLHTSPLFVCAVALTARGRAGGLDLVGFDLLKRIAEDEMTKILRAAENHDRDASAAITAVALATMFNSLSLATLRALPQAAALGLDTTKLRHILLSTRHAIEPTSITCNLLRLEPDLYAATFLDVWHSNNWNADTHAVLDQSFEALWTGADATVLLPHWNRLGYDAAVRLGRLPNWLDIWFAGSAFAHRNALAISHVLNEIPIWHGLLRSAATNGGHLLTGIEGRSADDAMYAVRARVLNNNAVNKASAGDRDGALEAAREAETIRRRLAQASPAAYESDLAISAHTLAIRLSEAGDRHGALKAARESLGIYRRLAKERPAVYEPDLAMSVNNLANYLGAVGDRDDALVASREAVSIYRRLAEANSVSNASDLAMSVNNLASILSATGDRNGALEAAREAVRIRRRLAQANPAVHEPDLAGSLNNVAICLSAAGYRDRAVLAAREAVAIRRSLALASASAYESDLAASVNNLSRFLSETGDRDGALKSAREAVAIYRRLANANPEAHEPDLAMSVNNLASFLSDNGDLDGALDAVREAVAIRRRLAEVNLAAYEPELATSLNDLASCLSETGDLERALEVVREATAIRRRWAHANPAAYMPDLAASINSLASFFWQTGERDNAVEAASEAVAIRRRLAVINPAAHAVDLARSLYVFAMALRTVGQTVPAREAAAEAVTLLTPLATQWPEALVELLGRANALLSEIEPI